jgi:tetratricopeptide (TPR) repeat protein
MKEKAACLFHLGQCKESLELFSTLCVKMMTDIENEDISNPHLLLQEYIALLFAKGEVLSKMEKHQEAFDVFCSILFLTPHDLCVIKKKAEEALFLKNYQVVVTETTFLLNNLKMGFFSDAVRVVECMKMKAFALFKLNRYQEAKDLWLEMIQKFFFHLCDEFDFIFSHIALCFLYLENHEKSIEYIDMALKQKPDAAMLWHIKSVACLSLGNIEKALACCEKALELDPMFHTSLATRSTCFQVLDNEKAARKDIEQLQKLKFDFQGLSEEKIDLLRKRMVIA